MSTIRAMRPVAGRRLAATLVRLYGASSRGLRRTVDLLLLWQQRARDRRQLGSLSDHMLRDIGLTRADVFAEASKPFWRP